MSLTTKLHVNDRIAIKYAQAGSSTMLETGYIKRIKRGIPRTVVIEMDGGITIFLLIDSPKKEVDHGSG